MRWSDRRLRAVRKALVQHGLRVICLGCRWEGRWHRAEGESGHLHYEGEAEPEGPAAPRLRHAACLRCRRVGTVRARWWVETHPDLASQAILRAAALTRTLEG